MPPLSGLPGFSGVRVAKPQDGAVRPYAAGASSRVCASRIADASDNGPGAPGLASAQQMRVGDDLGAEIPRSRRRCCDQLVERFR